jgi:hypothetical protein
MRYKISDMSQEMHELSNAVGLCDKTQLTIHIYPKMAPAKLWSSLWHEILHAMFEEAAIDIKEEEDLVADLERIQCSVFRDNPTLMKNLTRTLRSD